MNDEALAMVNHTVEKMSANTLGLRTYVLNKLFNPTAYFIFVAKVPGHKDLNLK